MIEQKYTIEDLKTKQIAVHLPTKEKFNDCKAFLQASGIKVHSMFNSSFPYLILGDEGVEYHNSKKQGYEIITLDQLITVEEEKKFITTQEELLKLHGRKVSCKVYGCFVGNANITTEEQESVTISEIKNNKVYIIGLYTKFDKYEDNNLGVTEIQLLEEPMEEKRIIFERTLAKEEKEEINKNFNEKYKDNMGVEVGNKELKYISQSFDGTGYLINNGTDSINITPDNFQAIKEFLEKSDFYSNSYNYNTLQDHTVMLDKKSSYKEGSRMWAFEMLCDGKKIKHRTYIKGDYIYLQDDEEHNQKGELSDIQTWFEDGWELYKEGPKTMTFSEMLELSRNCRFKFLFKDDKINVCGIWERKDGEILLRKEGEDTIKMSLSYIARLAQNQVEIIEEE